MGCLKLSYYDQEKDLEVNPKFCMHAVEKNGLAEKKRVSSSTYGFNGQEKDDEIKGNGNSYTAQYWQYDPRLGRRWNTDPVVKANWSGYAAFGDNPILFVDPNGDDWFENSAGRVEWFDNNSGGFLSDNQTAWSNIGGTLSANSATNDKLGGTLLAGQALVAISGPSDYSKLGSFDASASLFDNGGASYTTPGNGNVYFPTGSSPDASKLTHSNGVFNLNDNTSEALFANIVLSSFIYGYGYENIALGPESDISKGLVNHPFTQTALKNLAESGKDVWKGNIKNEANFSNIFREWTSGNPLTSVSHIIGSSYWTVRKQNDGTTKITIFNVTNVASAVGANYFESMGRNQGYPRPSNSSERQPYTNVSQTINLIIK